MGFRSSFFLAMNIERRWNMADLNDEKVELGKQVISAANIYKTNHCR